MYDINLILLAAMFLMAAFAVYRVIMLDGSATKTDIARAVEIVEQFVQAAEQMSKSGEIEVPDKLEWVITRASEFMRENRIDLPQSIIRIMIEAAVLRLKK